METRASLQALSILLLLLLTSSQVRAWQHASPAELDEALEKRAQALLIAFVLPVQKDSQALEADWAVVGAAADDTEVMSVDCAAHVSACIQLDVVAYPAVRLYHGDGRMDRYRGPRKSAPILAFLRRASRPVIAELNPATLAEFTSSDDIVFTAVFAPSEAGLYEAHYRSLASEYHDQFSFGLLLPVSQQQQPSAVRCRNNVDSESYTLTELWVAGALDELVTQCTAPLILEPGSRKEVAELAAAAARAAKGIVVHFFAASDADRDAYRTQVRALAKKYADELLFTIIDTAQNPAMPALAGLSGGVLPGVSVENLGTGQLFPYPRGRELSAAALEKFLGEVVGGAVEPWDGSRPGEVVHDEL